MTTTFAGIPVEAFAQKATPAEVANIVSRMEHGDRGEFFYELAKAFGRHGNRAGSIDKTAAMAAEMERYYGDMSASRFLADLLESVEAHEMKNAAE